MGALFAPIAAGAADTNVTGTSTEQIHNATNNTTDRIDGNSTGVKNTSTESDNATETTLVTANNTASSQTPESSRTGAATADASPKITNAVAAGSGRKTVIVRFDDPAQLPVGAADASPVGKMQVKATSSQDQFERFATGNPHVEIKDSFWIANAMLVRVDTAQVPLRRLAGVENVRQIHRNFKISAPEPEPTPAPNTAGSQQASPTSTYYTWGLNDIRAPETWQQFDNRGENVSVAVLDTGVDDSHPDIEVAKWKDFDGTPVDQPKDYGSHGTHVSGTIVGGDASDAHIGVAPNASLYVGAVLTGSGGSGNFSQVTNGMQWAVEQDADVLSMSLGSETNFESASYYIEHVQNARTNGTIPVMSIGNSGEGTSGAPGNVYGSISVGASTQSNSIADFSSGETISTSDWYDPLVPAYWPDSYVVPDISAPGTSVYSAQPDNQYAYKRGTSMAAPHVSGSLALLLSNSPQDLSTDEARNLLENTSVNLNEDPNRQGAGEIDVYTATLRHSWDTLQPTLSPHQANVSQQVELTASVNHPIDTYYWTLPNGSTVMTTDATLNHSFEAVNDSATVDIVLNDVRDRNQTVTKTVNITDLIPPTAALSANRSSAEVGVETVQFNASESIDNGDIDHYEWDFGDGTTTRTTDPVINHTYTTTGEKTVTLTVVDTESNTNQAALTITAQDTVAPTPRMSAPASVLVGEAITLDATNSTDNGQISSYSWEVEGKSSKSGQRVSYTFETDEVKTINLTVTDADDNTNSTETTVTVKPVPQVTITAPTEGGYVNTETVTLQYDIQNTDIVDAHGIQYRVTSVDGRTVVNWNEANFANTTTLVSNTTVIDSLNDGNYTIDLRIVDQTDTPLSYTASSANVSFAVKTTPPFYNVTITNTTTGVVEGDPLTVEYTVTNTGDVVGTQHIRFAVDGVEKAVEENISLASNEQYSGSFSYQTVSGDAPNVSVEVASENSTAVAQPQVEAETTDTFSLLDYSRNNGNSADISSRGLLRAVQDLRANEIGPRKVLAILDEFRSDDPIIETSIEDQNSTNGAEVAVTSVTYVESNFSVRVVNEDTNEVLVTQSDEFETGSTASPTFSLDTASIEDTATVSVTVLDASGNKILVDGTPIQDEALITDTD